MFSIPTSVILLTTILHFAGADMGTNARAHLNAGEVWMVPEGRALIQKYSIEINGKTAVTGSVRLAYSAPVVLEGRRLYPQISEGSFRRRDGEEYRYLVTAYYAIDDSQVTTLAVRAEDGSLVWDPPYVDLREPLVDGASWTFRTNYYSKNWEVGEKVEWDVTTEVVALAEDVDVPAGKFAGCLHTREHHRSVGPVILAEGPRTGERVFLEATTDRWWSPGCNTVRQIETQSTLSYGKPSAVLVKYVTSWELERVEGQ